MGKFLIGYLTSSVISLIVSFAYPIIDMEKVTNGKKFKIGNAVYKCEKIQELELE